MQKYWGFAMDVQDAIRAGIVNQVVLKICGSQSQLLQVFFRPTWPIGNHVLDHQRLIWAGPVGQVHGWPTRGVQHSPPSRSLAWPLVCQVEEELMDLKAKTLRKVPPSKLKDGIMTGARSTLKYQDAHLAKVVCSESTPEGGRSDIIKPCLITLVAKWLTTDPCCHAMHRNLE